MQVCVGADMQELGENKGVNNILKGILIGN